MYIIAGFIIFIILVVCIIFYEWTLEPLLMRFRLGRKKAIASREERAKLRDEATAVWAAESSQSDGKYQVQVVKRANSGRAVSMYKIGEPLSMNDDDFSIKRMDVLTKARIRAEELNSEAL